MKITVKKVFEFKVHAANLQPNIILMQETKTTAEDMIARWVYLPEEWRQFRLWQARKKGWLPGILCKLKSCRNKEMAVVTIGPSEVMINNERLSISVTGRQKRRVDIRDAGKMNILCICNDDTSNHGHSIQVPVPKGKLREAVEVLRRLET